MLGSFLFFIGVFVVIGVLSFRHSKQNTQDYYLASQSVKPWLVGLSAVATNNSGYMFIGVIGYTYSAGFSAVWLMLGWLLGDFLGSTFIHRQLHAAALRSGKPSFAGVLCAWDGLQKHQVQRVLALLGLVFLMAYAAAQLVAGSKALSVLLGWPIYTGAIAGAIIVIVYCLAGGIRASIWTDAAQSVVMIVAMSVLLSVSVASLGGLGAAYDKLLGVPGYLEVFPDTLAVPGVTGGLLFFFGWLVAGLSVIGQPHVMVRFMALNDNNSMTQARVWYYLWFTAFYFMATAVGMLARILLPDVSQFDAELALPTLAMELLPPVMVGLILAGIFAATMSTADSLVLACSSIISCDLANRKPPLGWAKISTVAVTLVALAWALLNSQSVFQMVVMSWSGLAGIFAPILILLALGKKLSQGNMLVIAGLGLAVALLWRFVGWHAWLYEGLPSIVLATIVGAILAAKKQLEEAQQAAHAEL